VVPLATGSAEAAGDEASGGEAGGGEASYAVLVYDAGLELEPPKTLETHVGNMFAKLGLLPAADDHRRVLAVLTYLRR
jgi:hypothetical protein